MIVSSLSPRGRGLGAYEPAASGYECIVRMRAVRMRECRV